MIEKSGNNKKENAKRENSKRESQKNEKSRSENNKSKFENAGIGTMKSFDRGRTKYDKSNGAGIVSKNLTVIGITAAAIVLFAVIMTYMMPNDSGNSGFDENAWRDSVTKAEEKLKAANGAEKVDNAAAVSSSALPNSKENDSLTDLSEDNKSDKSKKDDLNDNGDSKSSENAMTEDIETTESTYGVYTAEEAAAIATIEKLIMESPVDGGVLEDYSGDNLVYSKTMQDWRTHNGIDFAAAEGTEVKSAADGIIEAITENGMLGRTVIILHENGIRSIYSNLAEGDEAVVGNNILCGTVIGKVGNTAAAEVSEAPHLHFEVSVNEETVNPHDYLNIANATLQPLYD